MKFSRNGLISTLAAAVIAVFPAGLALSQAPVKAVKKGASTRADLMVSQMMVKLRNPTTEERVRPLGATRARYLSDVAGVEMEGFRPMSGGASVMRMKNPMTLTDAMTAARRLAQDPNVEAVEPDLPVRLFQSATPPPDANFATRQWNLFAPTSQITSFGSTKVFNTIGGANLQPAWAITTGSASVRVAVIDSGVTLNHTDLQAAMLPGYDFVSGTIPPAPNNFVANDGDGRDGNASDPGDWVDAAAVTASGGLCVAPDDIGDSSWHGTHMAGIIAAQWGTSAANGTSLAGIAPNVQIVPVRALGRCGGATSDVIDAMRWAGGLPADRNGATWATLGIPANANPARILNLSLGSSNPVSPALVACNLTASAITVAAVNELLAAGAIIFAATGNDGDNGVGSGMTLIKAPVGRPANCPGVIAVTAHTMNGDNADYANVGTEVAISAPGGGTPSVLPALVVGGGASLLSSDAAYYTWSTLLFGPTTPTSTFFAAGACAAGCTGPATAGFTGTSPATPHAAATAALLLSLSPGLTAAAVENLIRMSARPHPTGSYCAAGGANANRCGAGLLNIGAAVQLHQDRTPTTSAGGNQNAMAGAGVILTGSGSSRSGSGVVNYAWTQASGTPVTLVNANAATSSFTAPNVNGPLVFTLAVTDGNGYRNTATTSVTVSGATPPPPPPSGGGGGGGSLPLWNLLLIVAFGVAAGLRRRA